MISQKICFILISAYKLYQLVTKRISFSILTHAKQLSKVTFSEATAGIGKNESLTHRRKEVHTDVKSDNYLDYAISIES